MSEPNRFGICEQTLLAGLRRGDPASQRLLVTHYGPCVRATTRRYVRNVDDAADVFQETFIQIINSLDRFQHRSSLWAWIRGIAANVALRWLRDRKRHAELALEQMPPESSDDGAVDEGRAVLSTERRVLEDQLDEQVRSAVHALPQLYSTIILLRDFEGMSTREAACILGIEESAAKVRLHRARRALRERLSERFDHRDLLPLMAAA